jgi:hypothetical protein
LAINGDDAKTIASGDFLTFASGTWTGTGNLVLSNNARFWNKTGGVFDVQNDASITSADQTGETVNDGSFEKTGGGGTTTVQPVFENYGTLLLNSGTMAFQSTFSQVNVAAALTELDGGNFSTALGFHLDAGKLDGNGTIDGDVWSDGGEVVPGIDGLPGQLTITGCYTMTSASTLTINLTDGNTSCLNIPNCSPVLAGTLRVNRSADYKPVSETILTIITFPSFSGSFSTVDIPNNDWSAGGVDHLSFQPLTERGAYELIVTPPPPQSGGGGQE